MALTEIQRNRLRTYVQQKDRETEPVFVGRGNLFDLVIENARVASLGRAKERTVCIAGPPGIGKTAFLTELKRRSEAKGVRAERPVAFIDIAPSDLRDPPLVLAETASQLPKDWRPSLKAAKKLFGEISGLSAHLGSDNALQIGISATFRERPTAGRGGMPWGECAKVVGKAPPGAVVCLLIDEAQALSPSDGEDEMNWMLHSLHAGPPRGVRTPVFAVFAGLTHAPDVIEKTVSRLAAENKRFMGGLSDSESLQYINGTLDHFRVYQSDPGRAPLARWIAKECGRFPHHLRNAMSAVAEGMLKADSLALSDLNGAFVSERLASLREEYYEVRAEGAVSHVKEEIGKLLRGWDKGEAPRDKAAGEVALQQFLKKVDPDVRRLMKVEDGADLMAEMIRSGVLIADRAGGGCRCPIDSMIAWLASGGDGHALRSKFPTLTETGPKRRRSGPFP